jgi:hypothetical protein
MKGRGALFGSRWRGPRICGHAHTGSGQAPRVARRRVSSCKRSVLRPVGVPTNERELELKGRSGVAEPSTRCTQPPHFLNWANRFLFSVRLLAQTGWNLEARRSKIGKPRWIQNKAMDVDARDRKRQRLWFQAGAVGTCKNVLTLCCGVGEVRLLELWGVELGG